ncbi:MAG: ABC transporter permease, partial [Chloroflexota bacterium]
MTAATAMSGRTLSASERADLRRQRILGIVYIIAAAAILVVFALPLGGDVQSKFVLSLPGATPVPDLILPSAPTLYFLAFLAAFAGIVQLVRGFGAAWALVLGVVAFCFVFGFLTWVAAEGSMNLTGLLQTTVARSAPIIFGALSGILCERSGVINIAIEGMLLSSAFAAAVVGSITGDIWTAILAAMVTGALLGFLLAVLAIRYQVDQIIAGFVINILATGLTSYLHQAVLVPNATLNNPPRVTRLDIPVLSDIPVIGPIFFQH